MQRGVEDGEDLGVVGTELDDERSVFRTALKCICPADLIIIIRINIEFDDGR